MAITQRIHPCLWFDNQAEDAARVLHRHLQELEDQRDLPLRRGRLRSPSPTGRLA